MSKLATCYIEDSHMPVLNCTDDSVHRPFVFGEFAEGDFAELPVAEIIALYVKPKKSVRFNFAAKSVRTFNEDRLTKVLPKESLPSHKDDVHELSCTSGKYLDDPIEQYAIIKNNAYNSLSDKVIDHDQRKMYHIAPRHEVRKLRAENMHLLKDPIGYMTTGLLLGDISVETYSIKNVLDCISNIEEILSILKENNSFLVINYIQSFSVCNRPGKNQYPTIARKLEELKFQVSSLH